MRCPPCAIISVATRRARRWPVPPRAPAPRTDPTAHAVRTSQRMHLRHLSVIDFRSYANADLPLTPGVTTLIGLNGQGKTNLVEAAGYLATLGSHRVATDAPLVRLGASQAIIRGVVVKDGRETLVELELNPGRANRARLGRSPMQ